MSNRPVAALGVVREWLSRGTIPVDNGLSPSGKRSATIKAAVLCGAVFLTAAGARILRWQDSHVEIVRSNTSLMGVFARYQKEADRIRRDHSILFPREKPQPGDARMLRHPPGYSMLLAAIDSLPVDALRTLWLVQIAADGLAAVLVFLIASRLFGEWAGISAGMLVALSPQLAYYSLILTPDSLAVPPLLGAAYFTVLAMKRPRLRYFIIAGTLIGISCWLRANAMLLSPFLGLLVFAFFDRERRAQYALAVVGATVLVVAPLTIRNMIVFRRLIPISIEGGLALAEGVGDFDPDGKLGMPRSDGEALIKDVEWSGRQDYGNTLWFPDGIERTQARSSRALSVIRSRPIWFVGVALRRAAFMVRYNDQATYGWPHDSSRAGCVEREPPFSHELVLDPERAQEDPPHRLAVLNGKVLDGAIKVDATVPVWSGSPADIYASGRSVSRDARVTLDDGRDLVVVGDGSDYGDQFVSGPIGVAPYTDYVLQICLAPCRGSMALKVMSQDLKIAVTSLNASYVAEAASAAEINPPCSVNADDPDLYQSNLAGVEIQAPFASGPRSVVYLVFSNNGRSAEPPILGIGNARLIPVGATRWAFTGTIRRALRGLQKTIFTTTRMVSLIVAGIALLILARRFRALAVVALVPIYYMSVHSVLHTEYRYTLGLHYFAFMFAGVALYCAAVVCYKLVLNASRTVRKASSTGRRD